MKKTLLAASAVLALSSSFTVNTAENNKPQYLSNWWHQSINIVRSYHTHFRPQIHNNTYLEYKAFAKKDWFNFYGYTDAPVFFSSNSNAKGIWNHSSPLFMEIKPHFSINKLTNTDLSFSPFKEWYFTNNYIYNMGHNKDGHQSTWYMGLGTNINTGLPMSLSMNIYAKYQWQNYGAANKNKWDSYHFKIKYFVPITNLWGSQLSYISFTNFNWGSNLGDDSSNTINSIKTHTNNSITSSHILALNYNHWHYSVIAHYWHNSGQWNNNAELNFSNSNFNIHSTSWGGYLVVGYNF